MSDPENTEHRERDLHREGDLPSEGTPHSQSTSPPAAAAEPEADARPEGAQPEAPAQPEDENTSLYVRRGRTPTLGFWVVLALLVPTVAAMLVAPFLRFGDFGSVVNFMLVVAVFVGLPLAAIAALVDAIMHRSRRGRRR